MCSLPDDRTTPARIRDEALRLFGARGPESATVRDIAAAADVSPALVVRHYGSKDGLREAVDAHVAQVFDVILAAATDADAFDQASLPSLTEIVTAHLPADSPIPAYLSRLLVEGGPAGANLFRRLHAVSRKVLGDLTEAGAASEGADPDVRAAFLLVNDLAVLMLRARLSDVLGTDPLSTDGLRRWGCEVLSIYQDGLIGTVERTA